MRSSALQRIADSSRTLRQVRKVPRTEITSHSIFWRLLWKPRFTERISPIFVISLLLKSVKAEDSTGGSYFKQRMEGLSGSASGIEALDTAATPQRWLRPGLPELRRRTGRRLQRSRTPQARYPQRYWRSGLGRPQ
jgi:hypothetical protein